jgi:hypothetical protein
MLTSEATSPSPRGRGSEGRSAGRVRATAFFLLTLTACNPADQTATTNALAKIEAQQTARAEDDGMILCARGNAALTRSCTVEQTQGSDGLILTVRHPDGGFHRLLATRDGRGVVAADGAEPARVEIAGSEGIDVRLGEDHYRLPATVKSAQ